MKNLELLLSSIFPQNKIKVNIENNDIIIINIDEKNIKFKKPETELLLMYNYPDIDFSMEYIKIFVDEIKKQLNSN